MDTKSSPTESIRIVEEKSSFEQDSQPIYNPQVDTSGVDEKKLLRKIDFALIPWFSCLYLLSFLDRTSIGNAKVPGITRCWLTLLNKKKLYHLEADLKITDSQYLLALTVFFIAYATFEIPSNIVLKRFRPAIWFSTIMIGWGVFMTLQGAAHDFGSLTAIRWMLGTFEAGLYPGSCVAYHLSCWYKRSELGIRTAVFTSATTLSGAFGGLLAAAISKMGGVAGKPAWAWIFIIEGLVTIVAGILCLWFVQDFPESAKFLTEEERTFVIRRLQGDGLFSAAGEHPKLKNIVASFKDYKTWINMLQCMGCDMPLYAFSLFTPSIVNQVCNGFKATRANLLTVPIYAFAAIVTCVVAVYADRRGRRGMWNIIMFSIGGVGYIILIASRSAALSYFAVYVASCGIFPVVPNTITWIANNHEGSLKRGVALAAAISIGNLNGAVSSNVYRARDQPWYRLGHGLVLLYICIGIFANSLFLYSLKKENMRRDRGERDEVIGPETLEDNGNGRFASVEEAKREKGDGWSGYRYVL
ncbi:MFS domain-containing protein [Mycena indigotica]|uniref:MFS domain-containing protein n=1 Tax=Mycena indigotica TaxID=2126181 RepID=A0A8H6T1H6_9AGAR|nr:MFS domain-containing protein [Mycena indigotica]KAF7309928.1 MFS domain-containing protein [Mycena indigotica]